MIILCLKPLYNTITTHNDNNPFSSQSKDLTHGLHYSGKFNPVQKTICQDKHLAHGQIHKLITTVWILQTMKKGQAL